MTKISDLPGDISGIVTDAETSEPLDSVSIKIDPSSNNDNNVLSASDGTYLIKKIDPGPHEITTSKKRYEEVRRNIEVEPYNTTINDFELVLEPYPEISVKFLDFEKETITKSFTIKNVGSGTLYYNCQPGLDWVVIDHPNGDVTTETDTLKVTINRASITDDTYKELIRITSLSGEKEIKDTVHIYVNGLLDKDEQHYYRIVTIGTQTWMAENLNTGKMIGFGTGSLQEDNDILEKYCYENVKENCEIYGGIYQWGEMMGYSPSDNGDIGTTQGICPDGWHVPTTNEFEVLVRYLGANSGGKLKEAGLSHWESPNVGATNESGFTLLPGGGLYYPPPDYDPSSVVFQGIRTDGNLWHATMANETLANFLAIYHFDATVGTYTLKTSIGGASVRCIKDE